MKYYYKVKLNSIISKMMKMYKNRAALHITSLYMLRRQYPARRKAWLVIGGTRPGTGFGGPRKKRKKEKKIEASNTHY